MKKLNPKQRRLRHCLIVVLTYLSIFALEPIMFIIALLLPKYINPLSKRTRKLIPTQRRLKTNMVINLTFLSFLILSFICLVVAFLLPKYGVGPLFKTWDPKTIAFDISLFVTAIICFSLSLNCVNNAIKHGAWPKTEHERIEFFGKPLPYLMTPIGYGTITSYIGTYWVIWAAIISSGIIGMILTFPTKNKYKKWEKVRRFYLELNTPSKV
jgi:hypothetical protein